jgi:vitamin-K-epoxide reductase (warfarin-sensitive)
MSVKSWKLLVALVGIGLSAYAFYLDFKVAENPDYEASCDLSETISCTQVVTSEYGRLFTKLGFVPKGSIFDQPNAAYGMNVLSVCLATVNFVY